MRTCLSVFAACLFPFLLSAQTDSIRNRIFLIGDAGELENGHIPVIDWLKTNVNWNDDKNLAIFLGDNIYPDGLPLEGAPGYAAAKKSLDYQLDLLRGKRSKGYFILGNHDWMAGTTGGWQRAMNQVNYINTLQQPNLAAYPSNGCPGPVTVELSDKVVVVFMDSQWFLHLHDKPGPESACEARTIDEFTAELTQIVRAHPNQLLLLAMHHPMYTYGAHGGAYTLKSHIFPLVDAIPGAYVPLPILGSAYPLARGVFGTLQDTYHPLYRTMTIEIERVLKEHRNVVTAAGHEHSLQLIKKDSIHYIVSGSGSKLTRLREGKNSLFSVLERGFAVLEVRKSGKTEVKFYTLESTGLDNPVFARELKPITADTVLPVMDTLRPLQKNITVAPNSNLGISHLRYLFYGKNYRDEWAQQVTVPVLDLGKESGGLKPVRQTGGRQSKMLWLEEKNGKRWTLRPIGNFPEAAIPADLRQSNTTTTQGTSGNYPYADLFVAPLAKALNIPTPRRRLFYVPDDPRLDRYRADFKSTVGILEEEQPADVRKTISTDDLYLLLAKDNRNVVDQRKVLQARLLENFVMDFDRGENKYVWATRDTAQYRMYYPIPRDYDQAFFLNEGLFPRLIRSRWFLPQIQAFKAKTPNVKTFNYQARNFDRYFLNKLTEEEWRTEIDSFLPRMTDDLFIQALENQPVEVQSLRINQIIEILKQRRLHFKEEMLEYHRFLSQKVSIVGSDARELFRVETLDGKRVKVSLHKLEKGKASLLIYERMFDAANTDEIAVYGLADNDSFHVSGGTLPIRLRMVGGAGRDAFVRDAGGKNNAVVYDVTLDSNAVNSSGFINRISPDPDVNRFNRLEYKYNFTRPAFWIDYNKDDGFKPAASVETTLQCFRKEPFASKHFLSANYALQTRAFKILYTGDIRRMFGTNDLLLYANLNAPYTTNFFGFGNDTKIDLTKPEGMRHYRVSYSMGDFSAYYAKQLQSWMRVGFGPSFQFISASDQTNAERHISDAGIAPVPNNYAKRYAGADAMLRIDSRNNETTPTRGALITSQAKGLLGANGQSNSFAQFGLDLRIFMSFVTETKYVFATRFGFGHTFGDFEFPQAQYLTGTDNLRGYRRQRFGGRTMAFNNSELRLRLADFNTYLFRGAFGILAFNDIGRVWMDGENSSKWHDGYGGGIWYSPVKRTVIVGTLGFSKEEKLLPLLSFGYQF